ncbi:MAG: hypothetical protein ACI8P0_004537 [Planctomycetaceae bacterium]|jgi:hypothetical protein
MKTTSSRTIEVVVQTDGQTSIETKGFAGKECLEGSRFLEAALGARQDEQRTVEFYSTGVSTDVGVAQSNPGRSETM